jgi:Xaa-Pro aminopeptidase
MDNRIKEVQKIIAAEKLDGMIITNPANIFYLTQINAFDEGEKSFYLVIKKNSYKLISPRFYENRIKGLIPNSRVIIVERGQSMAQRMGNLLNDAKTIGFEREELSYVQYEIFKKILCGKKLIPISDSVEELRKIKKTDELALIKKAAAITDKTFTELLRLIKPGTNELFLSRKVTEIMQDLGAKSCSFNPVIASGKNSADPHYEGSNKKIKAGEMIVIDIGARYKNYDADMTRMVFIGKAPQKYVNLYKIVLETQEKALKDCQIGASPKLAFDNAVENFKKYREDQYFTHGLGHGVGIDIHELPNLSPAGVGSFENGMVFTVEPGLYHIGWGGIRIEDLCVMQNGKCVILSKTPKNLIEINC